MRRPLRPGTDPPEDDDPHDVDVHDGVALLRAGDVLLTLWTSAASASRIRWVHERAVDLIRQSPDGIVAVQLLLPSATPPGLGEVAEVRAGMREIGPHARRLIAVPLGGARWRSVVRAVMRAGVTLVGQAERIKIADSPAEALDLIAEVSSGATPTRPPLERALRALFVALGEPPPGPPG